jgi:uncharacterized protein (DUF885 family)
MTQSRTPTAVDALAERYLEDAATLDPILATELGLAGHDHELPELSPDWYAERALLRGRVLAELDTAQPSDSADRVTVAALREELEAALDVTALGADEADLKNIASPAQTIRDTFDLNSTETPDDWSLIATRLAAVPSAVHGYTESLRSAAARGEVVPRRQVIAAIAQAKDNVGSDGFFAAFARDAAAADGRPLPASLHAELERNAENAAHAYEQLVEFLGGELMAQAPEADAVGRDRYAVFLRSFLGTAVDLDETYAWGQEELARITREMQQTADRIKPGASIRDAIEFLDTDPTRTLEGTAALREWMQLRSDTAVAALADSHFDIPEPIRRLECRIAPTQAGGVYYTGPSEDLVTRPGRMWWSVPAGVTRFATWRELTTVYHEGVPGHHLQIAQTAYRRELLNRWRRSGSWVSGHGEGWALYAERLMADLGFLDDPANYLGMLDGQTLRAVRVVIDIGVHCQLPAPEEVGGGEWSYDKAWQLLSNYVHEPEPTLRFELDRYLGWPGQAPSYKIGERFWLELREEVRRRAGADFDVKSFHRAALDVGSLGLDVLRRAVLGEYD